MILPNDDQNRRDKGDFDSEMRGFFSQPGKREQDQYK